MTTNETTKVWEYHRPGSGANVGDATKTEIPADELGEWEESVVAFWTPLVEQAADEALAIIADNGEDAEDEIIELFSYEYRFNDVDLSVGNGVLNLAVVVAGHGEGQCIIIETTRKTDFVGELDVSMAPC